MNIDYRYPKSKEIINLLGTGAMISATMLMPGLGKAFYQIQKSKRKYEFLQSQKEWRKFNPKLLRRNLIRIYQQKLVEVVVKDGIDQIKLTQKGKTKFLKFSLDEKITQQKWQGKWYVIVYDISKLQNRTRDNFRRMLKQIRFLKLQKSVYLTPFSCQEEIDYLRHFYGIDKDVLILEVSKLENEEIYKEYFGL